MRKLFYATLLSFLCFTIGFSQKAINYISNDADLVFKINFKQLNEKYSTTEIEKLDWINDLRKELFRNSNLTLNSLGIDYNESAYFFGKLIDLKKKQFDAYWAIPIESETDFKNALAKNSPNLKETSLDGINIYSSGGKEFIAYTNNVVIIGSLNKMNLQDYLKTFNTKFKESKFGSKKADASVYFNNEVYNTIYRDALKQGLGSQLTNVLFKNFNPKYGKESTLNLFFNKNDIEVKVKSNLGKHYTKILRKFKIRKFNKSLLKYIDEDNLGYMTLNFNTKKYLESYPELLSTIYNGFYGVDKKEILAIYDLLSIFIDENDLADLLPGSGLFVVNDIKKQNYSYTSYRYNKNYEREEYQKKGTRTIPVFTIALETKKAKELDTVLGLVLRKAFEEKLDKLDDFPFNKVQLKNTSYYVIKENSDLKQIGSLAIYFDKDAIILTNDFNKIAKIGKKSNLNNCDKKLIRKNNVTFKFNLNSFLTLAKKEMNGSTEDLKIFETLKKNITNIELSSKLKKGVSYATFKISKPSNGVNSFEAIFKTLNEVYNIIEKK